MAKKTFKKQPLDNETEILIYEKWRTSKLNSIPDIAKEFNLPDRIVNSIINKYISTKTNY